MAYIGLLSKQSISGPHFYGALFFIKFFKLNSLVFPTPFPSNGQWFFKIILN